ncbi:MAG: electron transfer flavoprotein subunit alpha/FixB family protein [Anaerolineales bacterium]|nr:electron transfer flavoprotein subunit alpha/FixB family protein [Anaerolineales bacterium]
MSKLFVVVDQFKGSALPASWEAVSAARALADQAGWSVSAVVIGPEAEALGNTAIHYGADEALAASDASLADYRPEAYVALLTQLAKEHSPQAVLFPTTSRGRELAAMLAIDLESGVLPDVTEISLQDGKLVATRPIYAGKLLAKVICNAAPQLLTLRARAFGKPVADTGRSGAVTAVAPALAEADIPTKVVDYAAGEGRVSLGDAGVIVSGGRGVSNNPNLTPPAEITDAKEKEIWLAHQGFALLGELAEVLGAAVGASRAAVDAGYVPYAHQVGQTGKVVSPDLYIAAGISGAIQHLAGMRTSKVIVAINKDADAPIFKVARFGIVGDLYELLPALTQAFKERLSK